MRRELVLQELEELAGRIGIEIRYERMGTLSGGLCRIHDGRVILINKHLSMASKVELLAIELSREREKLENVYILPEIRELLDLS
ncbi:hypothetical protein DRQ36_07725 [bacterium]|nr:MAG: hypothetical protein DRQ36_07725 [bacterium]